MLKPKWLKRDILFSASLQKIKGLLQINSLYSVCEEAHCPNRGECFSMGTTTFLIMGAICTRNCLFCAVKKGKPLPLDPEEPVKVANIVKTLGLQYVVITSVTRDDLPDGGASHFVKTLYEIRKSNPYIFVELLIPDFLGDNKALSNVLQARPTILSHNLETVKRIYPLIRPKSDYKRSLELLWQSFQYAPDIPIKSGLMLGLGETPGEIRATLYDLHKIGCSMVTIGQYLQPTFQHFPVRRYLPPKEFEQWKEIAYNIGFSHVASGPFVRSSYQAMDLYRQAGSRQSRSFSHTGVKASNLTLI